jgi:hypothetical protein
MQSAHAILHHQGEPEENDRVERGEYGEADREYSSELDDEEEDAGA